MYIVTSKPFRLVDIWDLISIQNTAAINDYLSVAGLFKLRQQIVAFHKEWDNFALDVNNIIGQNSVHSNPII